MLICVRAQCTELWRLQARALPAHVPRSALRPCGASGRRPPAPPASSSTNAFCSLLCCFPYPASIKCSTSSPRRGEGEGGSCSSAMVSDALGGLGTWESAWPDAAGARCGDVVRQPKKHADFCLDTRLPQADHVMPVRSRRHRHCRSRSVTTSSS